jgi:DNA-binding XRE family transcriptional regulator
MLKMRARVTKGFNDWNGRKFEEGKLLRVIEHKDGSHLVADDNYRVICDVYSDFFQSHMEKEFPKDANVAVCIKDFDLGGREFRKGDRFPISVQEENPCDDDRTESIMLGGILRCPVGSLHARNHFSIERGLDFYDTRREQDDGKQAETYAAQLLRQMKERREYLNMSQRELSERSGVAQKTISLLENGKNDPEMTTLVKLAGAMGSVIKLKVIAE